MGLLTRTEGAVLPTVNTGEKLKQKRERDGEK